VSNGKYYNSLSSLRIFECIPRIFGIRDTSDRRVQVDSYLKSPNFSASNGKCHNSLSSFWIFECIPRVLFLKRIQKFLGSVETHLKRSELSASNAINLTFFWITDSERNKIDNWVVTVEL